MSISLHWLMLILVVAVYACMELREYYPKGSEFREGLKTWHFMLGLTVLLLLIVRIIARAMGSTPPIAPEPPAWQARFAKIAHTALYLFMFAMPIAGWVILSASGKVIPFFLFDLPALVSPNKALADQVNIFTKRSPLSDIMSLVFTPSRHCFIIISSRMIRFAG
jgi:superoxide oxidase